jgi:hypothetical protein
MGTTQPVGQVAGSQQAPQQVAQGGGTVPWGTPGYGG